MTGLPIRRVPGGLVVTVPVDGEAPRLAALLRRSNDQLVRSGHPPVLLASALASALGVASLIAAVPPTEQHVDGLAADGEPWLTTAAAAVALGIGIRGVRQRISRGTLDARRVGRTWLVRCRTTQEAS